MNKKDARTDSGSYVNGVYTTKNGFSGLGVHCPKGTRLYQTNCPIFFLPDDLQPGEEFRKITRDVAPDIMPYYAISNYGRVMNVNSMKIMKPNYKPSGYEYICLAADNCKNGQKKYYTHRMVMMTFDPRDNADELYVDHVYNDKTKNYINKIMPDGSIDSGLRWATPKENTQHSVESGSMIIGKLSMEEAKDIRDLHDQGYSYEKINYKYPQVSSRTIQNICLNKTYTDPNYTPKSYFDSYKANPANVHKLTDQDAERIRDLSKHGFSYIEIRDKFYPNFSVATVSDIVRGKTHIRGIN